MLKGSSIYLIIKIFLLIPPDFFLYPNLQNVNKIEKVNDNPFVQN